MFPYRPTHALFAHGFISGKLACQLLMAKGYYSRESLTSVREHYREHLDDIEWLNEIRRDKGAYPPVVPCSFRSFRDVVGLRRIVQDRLAFAQRRAVEKRASNELWSSSFDTGTEPA